ncbi:hypothetical protein F4803DRAFT_573380 [Xylaria telfairii]|nr:hypothetical protein F4803DRAFT_573380 [Xylaria telfairii]
MAFTSAARSPSPTACSTLAVPAAVRAPLWAHPRANRPSLPRPQRRNSLDTDRDDENDSDKTGAADYLDSKSSHVEVSLDHLDDNNSASNRNSNNNPNSSLTSHEYVHAIFRHSRRSALTSSFPGRNYIDLANWLLPQTPNSRPPNCHLNHRLPSTVGDDKHWLAVLHHLSGHEHDCTQLLAHHDVSALEVALKPASKLGNLLFLRGYLPPSWIAEIGSRYRIDPEFFARHLDFFGPSTYRDSFDSPSLITTNNNIIHVYVNTILTNESSYPQVSSGFAAHHREIKEQLSKYKHQLQRSANCGDSIVREYTVLSPQYAVIEQRFSICISPDGEGWVGLVWMDNGRSLEVSPPGPWTSDIEHSHYSSREAALPIIKHYQKMAFRKVGDIEVNSRTEPATATSPRPANMLPQCSSILPLEYPSLLSAVGLAGRATSDALHALIPVFAHAAFSEVAFLNLISRLVEELIVPLPIGDFRTDSFERLQEYNVILERHAGQLRHCLRAIRVLKEGGIAPRALRSESRRLKKDTPSSSAEFQLPEASTYTAEGILEDYEDLLDRCTCLQSRTAAAMSTEMNRAMILESRRAIEQTERMKKLTLMATYFIPLTLAASIFGMNFELFGQGHLPLWWYFVLAAPLTLLTHLGSTLDVPAWTARISATLTRHNYLKGGNKERI